MSRGRSDANPSCRCGAVWSGVARAHCTGCHYTYNSVGQFDRHRSATTGCIPLDTLGFVVEDGIVRDPEAREQAREKLAQLKDRKGAS